MSTRIALRNTFMHRAPAGACATALACILALAACAARSGAPAPGAAGGPSAPAASSAHRPPAPTPPPPGARVAQLELVTTETDEATALVAAPEPERRLFVVEKKGLVRILRGHELAREPFLDLRGQVALDARDNGEQGLLGLAFHPRFADNGLFYVNYTDVRGATRIEERRRSGRAPDRAEPEPVRLLFHAEQPYRNHNAGDLAFGPDGWLYFGTGDGGSANDPHGHGQNPASPLGKLFRLDVAAARPVPELLALGLRNPWRIAFDRQTGDLYVADVGQNRFEYVHVVRADQLAALAAARARGQVPPPINLGWNVMEGFHCFDGPCDPARFQPPVVEYDHRTGCSITGGFVYRGRALPELSGRYFYADYCTAIVHSLRLEGGRATEVWDWKGLLDPEARLARISSFGQDHDGELYLVTHEGPIYRLVPRPRAAAPGQAAAR